MKSSGTKFLLSITLVLVGLRSSGFQLSIEPDRLACEYLENPLGIDTPLPRFGWTLKSDGRNVTQTGYEILVGTDVNDIASGKGNVWSSGRVNSDEQNQIVYGGSQLRSFTRYYWTVRVYGNRGEVSAWSLPSWFETAMLNEKEWQAKWISDGSVQPEREQDHYKADQMPLFRKQFAAKGDVASARLYISGLGYYEAFLNGKKIGDRVLDPGWTTYRKQVMYSVYDVTEMVSAGENVAGIMLGNGWWNPLPFKFFGRWNLRDYQQTGRPCVKAEFHIQYSDGTKDIIPTDKTWLTTGGPVVRNNVYLGEHYAARLEVPNWRSLKTDLKKWKVSSEVNGPDGTLTVQMQPAIKVTKILKPVSIIEQKPGVFIVDMGQNFAGVARLKVKGPAGTKVTLRYGEGLFEDGSINVMTTVATQIKKDGIKGGPGAPETAWQEDSYTLKGDGIEVWSPRFTFHGFRYIEITGWPGKPTLSDVEGLRMNADLQVNGAFSCSNELFNKIHEVVQWTFLSNVFSVQSDCPGREKMGYGGDIVATANAFLFNYDMSQFYTKTVDDFRNEQRPEGGITEIAPFTGIADRGYGDLSGPLGWQLAFPFAQKQLYEFYGDTRIIAENYPAFQKQLAFLKSKAQNNLFYWDISDHEAIDPKPEALSASAFYYHHLKLASEFAGILGKDNDSVSYEKESERVRRSIVRQFHVPGTGRFDNATQSAQLFALWYNLTPDRQKSLDVFFDELKRHKGHLSTGIFTTRMFFDVMRQIDRNDVAYDVVDQKDFPGWGYMIERGATTLWESWDFPETGPSRNHPMFGSVDEWFYRSLLGINPAAPGFKKIVIKPQPAGDLTWAKGSYESIRGRISVEWRIEDENFHLDVNIPPNIEAEIWIPSTEGTRITEGKKPVDSTRSINGYTVAQVGSGHYNFVATR